MIFYEKPEFKVILLTRWTTYGDENEPSLAAEVEVPIPMFLK